MLDLRIPVLTKSNVLCISQICIWFEQDGTFKLGYIYTAHFSPYTETRKSNMAFPRVDLV